MLPDTDHDHYMASLLRGSGDLWRPALEMIADLHGVAVAGATPLGVGRNVVVATSELVVKLVPPFWRHMWWNECEALQHVSGHLSVRTPRLEAAGEIDGWGYIVMEREAGNSPGWRGDQRSRADRSRLARLQGRLVREVGSLKPIESIRWLWPEVLADDRAALADDLVGVPERLADSAADYVDAAGDLASGDTFLHGDLSSINILLAPAGDTVLVDWSDAAVGPLDH
ncbi:MAG: phosphotransferase, partial [Acidimicrobiia bacterium]